MIEFHASDVVVLIYEGNTEKYVLEMLLEQEVFKFAEWQLLDGRMFKRSNTQHRHALETQYFPLDYGNSRLVVLLIQDDDASLKIKEEFLEKLTGPVFVVTKPEIEMLMVHSLNLYDDFHKARTKIHQLKPSQFVASAVGENTSRIKSEGFVKAFYSTHSLVEAIICHGTKANRERGKYLLVDIIN